MLIYVEGNIGCGKSTLLEKMAQECAHDKTIRVVQEGLDEWMQVSDSKGNILDHFYQDKEKYSFVLQMVILTQRHF
jgi:deoxyadenosine/deoxycytidine kinase